MKNFAFYTLALLVTASLSGCGLIEGGFKLGFIFAVLIVAIIGAIVWALRSVAVAINKKYTVVTVPVREN